MDNPESAKKVFVAATMQDQGKTTFSLGLMAGFNELCPPVGFMKPVGQRYVEIGGVQADEDVALMRAVFPAADSLADMSPITVGRKFTRSYISQPRPSEIMARIQEAYDHVARGKKVVVIEGTGHAGVGSCFDASNADVAHLLGAKVILIAGGGIGKPIDEVMLNESLFRSRGVELLGVVLNKVMPEKIEEIREVVGQCLARKGIRLLGCVPYNHTLEEPSMQQLVDELGGKVLSGKDSLHNAIDGIVVGAMTAARAMEYLRPGCLLITPGDRDDMIEAAVAAHAMAGDGNSICGLLLTGGVPPSEGVMTLIRNSLVPVVLVGEDSYTAAAAVTDLKVKIQPDDIEKIAAAPRLVRSYVDIPRIFEML